MDVDLGESCGIPSPNTFDNCSHHRNTSDDLRPSPAALLSMAINPSTAEQLQTYVIKATGTPVNVFSDEEFVDSCSEPEIETAKADNNDCKRVSTMFNTLVGFLLDVEQYLYESENVTKAQLLKKVTSTRKMLKRNSDLFFDMADFLTSKSGSSGMTNDKLSNDEFISHNLVSVFTEVNNTKEQVVSRKSSSGSHKENASKIPKRIKKRCSKKRPFTSGHKLDSEKTPVDNNSSNSSSSNNNNNNNNKNNNKNDKENKTAQEDDFIVHRRRSSRPRARRSVYFNGEKMHLNSVGELIPLSSGQNAENQMKTRKRKTMETTPNIKKNTGDNNSQDGSMKRQLYSPDVWLKHINDTGIY